LVKIELEIPDWAIGRHITVLAGVELLAQMQFIYTKTTNPDGTITRIKKYMPMAVKPEDGRCNGCGDCCSTGGSPFSKGLLEKIQSRLKDYEWQGTGNPCPLLGDEGCTLGTSIPYSCISSNCEGWSENCTEKLISIDDIQVIMSEETY